MSDKIDYAIILGTTAIVVAVITQVSTFVISLRDKEHQRKSHLREKYEEMMFHFSESLEYMVHLNGSRTEESVFSLALCPSSRKALNLCMLYFQDLTPAANDYVRSLYSYYECVITSYDENDSNTAGGQANLKSPNYNNALKNYQNKKDEFEHLIMDNVHKYTDLKSVHENKVLSTIKALMNKLFRRNKT